MILPTFKARSLRAPSRAGNFYQQVPPSLLIVVVSGAGIVVSLKSMVV